MRSKYPLLIYLALLIISIVILANMCMNAKESIVNSEVLNYNFISALQKKITIANIVCFTTLIALGLWIFSITKRVNYLILSIILFVCITLYNHVTLTKLILTSQGKVPANEGAYWLVVFVGIFYILGAILVAAIGYIAVKNYTKRYINNEKINRIAKRRQN